MTRVRTIAASMVLVTMAMPPHPVGGQDTAPEEKPSMPQLAEGTEVRLGDVLVAIARGEQSFLDRNWPGSLSLDDFEVSIGGVPVPVVALDETFEAAEREEWRSVIYFDTALSSTSLLRHAASILAASAPELARLGPVEIVIADPDPRWALAPEREAGRIGEVLSGLALTLGGGDLLVAGRRELPEVRDGGAPSALGLGAHLDRELRTIRMQEDRLVGWLGGVERLEPRRVLFLVSGGYDLYPASFYRARYPGIQLAEMSLEASTSALARMLAVSQWVTFVVARPQPDPLPRRWGLIRSLLVRADGNWDPEAAETHLELGRSLVAQKKWKRAEEALRRAAYHYHEQPKLRPRQAEALLGLAVVLDRLKRPEEADAARRKAVELDPSRAGEVRLADLLDPLPPLVALGRATAGGIVRDKEGLDEALVDLPRRVRLSYQLGASEPEGAQPLEVVFGSPGFQALAPAWAGRRVPERIAEARARLIWHGELDVEPSPEQVLGGEVSIGCVLTDAAESALMGAARLELALELEIDPVWEGVVQGLRVTTAVSSGADLAIARSLSEESVWRDGGVVGHEFPLVVPTDDPMVAVVVEEMTTERWFATVVECAQDDWPVEDD